MNNSSAAPSGKDRHESDTLNNALEISYWLEKFGHDVRGNEALKKFQEVYLSEKNRIVKEQQEEKKRQEEQKQKQEEEKKKQEEKQRREKKEQEEIQKEIHRTKILLKNMIERKHEWEKKEQNHANELKIARCHLTRIDGELKGVMKRLSELGGATETTIGTSSIGPGVPKRQKLEYHGGKTVVPEEIGNLEEVKKNIADRALEKLELNDSMFTHKTFAQNSRKNGKPRSEFVLEVTANGKEYLLPIEFVKKITGRYMQGHGKRVLMQGCKLMLVSFSFMLLCFTSCLTQINFL